jgi:cell division protein ZapA
MANRITISICGEDYTLVADENAAYMEKVGSYVSEKMGDVLQNAHVGRADAAVLTAVNIADELFKSQETAENLRRQLKTYLDEAAKSKTELSELKRELFKAQNRH